MALNATNASSFCLVERNFSANTTAYYDYEGPMDQTEFRIIFILLYSVVFVLAFFGNTLVITVVLRHRRMRTVTNFFLANLAVADLSVSIFCILPNMSLNLNADWQLGRSMCKLYYFVQAMSYTASVTILTVISIERYIAIIYPLRAKQLTTMTLLRVTVIVIWVLSAVNGIPYLIFYDQVSISSGCQGSSTFTYCVPVQPINTIALVTTNFVIGFLAPLLLMSALYTHISITLWKSTLKTTDPSSARNHAYTTVSRKSSPAKKTWTHCDGPGRPEEEESDWPGNKKKKAPPPSPSHLVSSKEKASRQPKQESALLARRKVIRLLISVLLTFTLCTLPYHVRVMWQAWADSEIEVSYWLQLFSPCTFVIFYSNSALNPLLYAFLSEKFRKGLIEVVTCKLRRRAKYQMKSMASTACH